MFRRNKQQHETGKSFVKPEAVKSVGKEAAAKSANLDSFEPTVIYDGKTNGYSVAIGTISHNKRVCAIRWNGEGYDDIPSGELSITGTPQQGSAARWFVLPEFLWEPTIEATYNYMRDEAKAWMKS